MAIASVYNTGTASVAAGNTAVTGVGTTWLTSGLQAGDIFWANGMSCRIASVNSNTSITLAYPWPGTTLSGGTYEVRFTPDATRVLAAARALIDMLGSGLLAAIAAAGSSASKLMYYTGPGAVALADLTAHGRSILGLSGGNGKFIRSTAGGTAVMADILGTVSQSGGVPTGSLVEKGSNANGEYVRFSDGTQICWLRNVGITAGVAFTWTYPAAFSATTTTSLIGISSSSAASRVFGGLPGASTAVCNLWTSSTGAEVSGGVNLMAIGRWYN
ncbi:MAG TPA: hypothetical protein VL202_12965 [Pararhizobium sp.]|uniref:hypothetical protein n=1 Tax=Pararhizobium sp. TaxID=1977563 RepID=UPI002CAAAA1F|nr:hypothetical protein [Pararhizobium sp.]HTO32073.1 hypothetical protein [Pararhizobium sp.]